MSLRPASPFAVGVEEAHIEKFIEAYVQKFPLGPQVNDIIELEGQKYSIVKTVPGVPSNPPTVNQFEGRMLDKEGKTFGKIEILKLDPTNEICSDDSSEEEPPGSWIWCSVKKTN